MISVLALSVATVYYNVDKIYAFLKLPDELMVEFPSSSSYEGWDNPFRPEGELSHEAEELLRLWKQGKLKKGEVAAAAAAAAAGDTPDGKEVSKKDAGTTNGGVNTSSNGKAAGGGANGGTVDVVVKKEVAPVSHKPQHVNIKDSDAAAAAAAAAAEPKKKKQGCCSLM